MAGPIPSLYSPDLEAAGNRISFTFTEGLVLPPMSFSLITNWFVWLAACDTCGRVQCELSVCCLLRNNVPIWEVPNGEWLFLGRYFASLLILVFLFR